MEGISTVRSLKNYYLQGGNYKNDWLSVQEWMYTKGLKLATLRFGAAELFSNLYDKGADMYIVSHKTKFSAGERKDLVTPATDWISKNIPNHLIPIKSQIFFEATRDKKIARISALNLTHFVDDLVDIFLDKKFPTKVKSFWLTEKNNEKIFGEVIQISSLLEIKNYA